MRIVRWSNSESIYALDFRCNILPLRNTVCILLDECGGMGSVDWHTVYIITVCQNNISNRALLASCGKSIHIEQVLQIGAKLLQIGAVITNWGRIITNRNRHYKLGQLLRIGAEHCTLCKSLHKQLFPNIHNFFQYVLHNIKYLLVISHSGGYTFAKFKAHFSCNFNKFLTLNLTVKPLLKFL